MATACSAASARSANFVAVEQESIKYFVTRFVVAQVSSMIRGGLSSFKGFDRRIYAIFVGRIIAATGFSIVMPFLTIYLSTQLGISLTVIGILFLINGIFGSLGQIIGGELSDRIGRRPVMWSAMFLRAMAFIALSVVIALHLGFPLIALCVLGSALVGSMFEPATNALVADLVPSGRRLEAYSLFRIGQNLGWSLGPLLGGLLAMLSYSTLFLFSAIANLATAAIIYTMLSGGVIKRTSKARFSIGGIFKTKEIVVFLLFCIISIPMSILMAQMSSTYTLFSTAVVGVSTAEVGYLFAVNGFMVVIMQFPIARYLCHFKMTTSLTIGSAFYVLGYFLVGLASDFQFLVFTMVIITVGELITSPSATNLVANMSPDAERGRYMGLFGLFSNVGWASAALVGGIFYDHLTAQPVLLWAGIATVGSLSVLGYLFLGSMLSEKVDRVPSIS